MNIYLLPGLGFDHRIFSNLKIQKGRIHYINWIEPLKDESIRDYALRLAEDISEGQENILIGHSLGGILSQEIACFKDISKVILVSSIKHKRENTLLFRAVKPFRLYKLFTKEWTIKSFNLWGKQHDYVSGEEQALFKSMVGAQSNTYLQWALSTLSIWQQPQVPSSTEIIQISGDSDKTFPIGRISQPDYVIKGGGHFMIFKHPKTISEIINNRI